MTIEKSNSSSSAVEFDSNYWRELKKLWKEVETLKEDNLANKSALEEERDINERIMKNH